MHGNVTEWCLDVYGPYPGGSVTDPRTDPPTPPPSDSLRLGRGGGWGDPADRCRSAERAGFLSTRPLFFIGFRLVLAPARP